MLRYGVKNKNELRVLLTRSIVSCLLVSMTLTGCHTNSKTKTVSQTKVAMGRYMEESIELQKFIKYETKDVAIWEDENGKLQALVLNETLTGYEEETDGKWEEIDMPLCKALNQIDEQFYELGDVIITPGSKKIYIQGYKENAEGKRGEFYFAQFLGSTLKEIDVSWNQDNTTLDLEVKVDEEGDIFILDIMLPGVQIFDGETGKLKQVVGKEEDIRDFTVVGNQVFTIGSPNVLNVYNINDGMLQRSVEGVEVDVMSQIINADQEGSVYILTTEGVFKLPKEGSVFEKVIEGDLCSLGSISIGLKDAWVYKGVIYAALTDNPFKVVKYVYHDEIPTVPEIQVTIYTLRECDRLRQAADIYKKKHPDAYIKFEGTLNVEDRWAGKGEAEAISILNTEILAGEGPDIFVLDGLPVDAYMKNGVLADLTQFIDEKTQSEGLLNNLMKTYQIDQNIYAIPLGFHLVVGVGEKELTQDGISLEKLVQYKNNHPDKDLIHSTLPGIRIRQIGSWWEPRLFDKEGKVNTAEMKTLLQGLKTITPKVNNQYALIDYIYGELGCNLPEHLLYDQGCVEIDQARAPNSLQVIAYINEHYGDSQITTKIDGEENIATAVETIGINSASKNQEAAKEIMSIALSKEVQSDGGFSVRNDLLEDCILHPDKYYEFKPMYIIWEEDATVKDQVEFEWGYEKEMQQFLESCKKAKLMKPMDPQLYEIIKEESEAYFNDDMEIDETVNNISQKINLYLSEQS